MNLVSRLVERMLDLPPPLTRDVLVARDLAVPMRDGVTLLADRWYPKNAAANLPVVLLRSPYGRRGIFGSMLARPLAERGFQVLMQSTRAGFGSGGAFDPLKCEREDGLATLDWLGIGAGREQHAQHVGATRSRGFRQSRDAVLVRSGHVGACGDEPLGGIGLALMGGAVVPSA